MRPAQHSKFAAGSAPRIRLWAFVGSLLGAALAMVWFAPAPWLALAVQQMSGERLHLLQARGTLWNGSAQLALSGGPGGQDAALLPGRLSWTLRPSLDGLSIQISVPCCARAPLNLLASASSSGATLNTQALDLRLPAAVLAGLGAPWSTLGLHGALRLQSPALSAQREQGQVLFNGTATLEAKDMSSRLSPLRPLGDYRVELSGGAPARVQLRTLGEAALLLEGVGQWNGTRLVLRGQAKAGAGHEESLSNLLNIIGRRQGPAALITLG